MLPSACATIWTSSRRSPSSSARSAQSRAALVRHRRCMRSVATLVYAQAELASGRQRLEGGTASCLPRHLPPPRSPWPPNQSRRESQRRLSPSASRSPNGPSDREAATRGGRRSPRRPGQRRWQATGERGFEEPGTLGRRQVGRRRAARGRTAPPPPGARRAPPPARPPPGRRPAAAARSPAPSAWWANRGRSGRRGSGSSRERGQRFARGAPAAAGGATASRGGIASRASSCRKARASPSAPAARPRRQALLDRLGRGRAGNGEEAGDRGIDRRADGPRASRGRPAPRARGRAARASTASANRRRHFVRRAAAQDLGDEERVAACPGAREGRRGVEARVPRPTRPPPRPRASANFIRRTDSTGWRGRRVGAAADGCGATSSSR